MIDPSFIEYSPDLVKSLAEYAYLLKKENQKLKGKPHGTPGVLDTKYIDVIHNITSTMYVQETLHPQFVQQDHLDENLLTNIGDIVNAVIHKDVRRPDVIIRSLNDINNGKFVKISESPINAEAHAGDVKAEIKQPLTDLVTLNFFKNATIYYSFIGKFISFFQRTLDGYKIEKYKELQANYPGCYDIHDKILFIFKGGNLMRAVFLQYLNEQPAIVSDTILEAYGDYFKNSDLDFQIIIHPQLHPDNKMSIKIYDSIHNDMIIMSYLCLNRFRNYFSQKIDLVLDFYQLNNETKKNIMKKAHVNINKASVFDPKNEQLTIATFGEDARMFVGAKIENLRFYDIHTNPEIHQQYVDNIKTEGFMVPVEHEFYNTFLQHFTSFPRTDFYLTQRAFGNTNYMLAAALPPIDLDSDKEAQYKVYSNKKVASEFYVTVNDSIAFASGEHKVHFALVRMKCNMLGYITLQDGTHGMMHIPGELFDISIAASDDIKNEKMINKPLLSLFEKYTFTNANNNFTIEPFEYYSYNLHSFIVDLENIIYKDFKYPWIDKKYEKRLKRIYILCIVELLGSNVYKAVIAEFVRLFIKTLKTNVTLQELDDAIDFLKANGLDHSGMFILASNNKILNHNVNKKITDLGLVGDVAAQQTWIKDYQTFCDTSIYNLNVMNTIQLKINEYLTNTTQGHVDLARLSRVHQLGGYKEKYLKYKKKYIQSQKF